MRVFVDADACPVKEIIVNICKSRNIEVVMVIDTSHILNDGYSKVVTVDKANDSADLYILNAIGKQDVLVTQDYGLASVALARCSKVINQNGFLYTSKNIDELLFKRYVNKQARKAGKKTTGSKKRTQYENQKFEDVFKNLFDTV